jgi:predicted DNA-binding transcriptional regulator YafY
MPRLTSEGPATGRIALKQLDKPVAEYTDEELEVLLAAMEGVRSMPSAPRKAGGASRSTSPKAEKEFDFDNIG